MDNAHFTIQLDHRKVTNKGKKLKLFFVVKVYLFNKTGYTS